MEQKPREGSEANGENLEANQQKIFDVRFLHDRVTGEKSLFYEQIGGFCRATIFVK